MGSGASALRPIETSRPSDTVNLMWLCVENRENAVAWSEFLRRILPKLQYFARGSCYGFQGNTSSSRARTLSITLQESDLVQMVIVRLIEGNCLLLRRFLGKTDDELFIYLAIICRSAARDALRRQNAIKRCIVWPSYSDSDIDMHAHAQFDRNCDGSKVERLVLLREVKELAERMLSNLSGPSATRDRLIFKLYFYQDLSLDQIARCQGINLTKAGVEKALSRLKRLLGTMVIERMPGTAA